MATPFRENASVAGGRLATWRRVIFTFAGTLRWAEDASPIVAIAWQAVLPPYAYPPIPTLYDIQSMTGRLQRLGRVPPHTLLRAARAGLPVLVPVHCCALPGGHFGRRSRGRVQVDGDKPGSTTRRSLNISSVPARRWEAARHMKNLGIAKGVNMVVQR